VPIDVVVQQDARRLVGAAACRKVAQRLRAALRRLGRARSSATLVFSGDDEIRTLNREFRGLDRATDVLSFHMQKLTGETDPAGDAVFLGDIVMSVQTASRRAGRARLDRELERLAVHGLCHLFGHDHHRPAQARRMRALERRLLAQHLDGHRVREDGSAVPGLKARGSQHP
jgi:probable rRNA maturation factor